MQQSFSACKKNSNSVICHFTRECFTTEQDFTVAVAPQVIVRRHTWLVLWNMACFCFWSVGYNYERHPDGKMLLQQCQKVFILWDLLVCGLSHSTWKKALHTSVWICTIQMHVVFPVLTVTVCATMIASYLGSQGKLQGWSRRVYYVLARTVTDVGP